MTSDQELEDFKRTIDLREYAAGQGYTLDKRESWRGSAVMRNGGDKVVIKRDADSHYVYFSVRDGRDNGSIVDFIQHRKRMSLGEVRKELRPWVGRAATSLPSFPPLEKTSKDRLRVETEYRRMQDAPHHPYLERERRIPADVLASDRFAGRVRMDARNNAVFPHFDEQGLCGYELKNRNFTGFARGGEKGLWFSRTQKDDVCLVFAESAIDALSYAALNPGSRTRYASIGGEPNPKQPGLIKAAVLKMAPGAEIISAMDNDPAGRELSAVIAAAVKDAGRSDLTFREDLPAKLGDDWNQVLHDRVRPSFPTARFQKPVLPKLPGM
jgi:hypothetical protein